MIVVPMTEDDMGRPFGGLRHAPLELWIAAKERVDQNDRFRQLDPKGRMSEPN